MIIDNITNISVYEFHYKYLSLKHPAIITEANNYLTVHLNIAEISRNMFHAPTLSLSRGILKQACELLLQDSCVYGNIVGILCDVFRVECEKWYDVYHNDRFYILKRNCKQYYGIYLSIFDL